MLRSHAYYLKGFSFFVLNIFDLHRMCLCRLKLPVTSEGAGGKVVFNNLADDQELFTAHGDYQFDIYRKMQEANGDEWKSFHPQSNVFWLHYLSDKLISGLTTIAASSHILFPLKTMFFGNEQLQLKDP